MNIYGSVIQNLVIQDYTFVPSGNVGNTQSTVSVTYNGTAASGTANGSPFTPAVNNYVLTAPASVPPYNTVSAAGVPGFNFGTGDFTIEWFQYQTDSNAFPRPFWYCNAGSSTYSWGVSIESGNFYFWNASLNTLATSAQIGTYKNTWTHFAVVRSSGSLRLYKNGTQIGSTVSNSLSMTNTSSTLYVGGKPYGALTSEQFGGSITSFRICNMAVYTGTFTRPTSPLGQTQSANPYGGANTAAITSQCVMLLNP
jgi:Concanavalin A-like lectin/glucanases superfamily